MNTKQCSRCKNTFPFSSFSPDKKMRLGISSSCRACKNERHKDWLRRNPEKMALAKKRWNENNPEKISLQKKRSRERHRERLNKKDRAYRKNNPTKIKAVNCNSKALIRGAKSRIESAWLVEKFASVVSCEYCGSTGKLSFDHKTPLVRGGEHSIENIAIICLSCNGRKGGMTLREFKIYCSKKNIPLIIS